MYSKSINSSCFIGVVVILCGVFTFTVSPALANDSGIEQEESHATTLDDAVHARGEHSKVVVTITANLPTITSATESARMETLIGVLQKLIALLQEKALMENTHATL